LKLSFANENRCDSCGCDRIVAFDESDARQRVAEQNAGGTVLRRGQEVTQPKLKSKNDEPSVRTGAGEFFVAKWISGGLIHKCPNMLKLAQEREVKQTHGVTLDTSTKMCREVVSGGHCVLDSRATTRGGASV